MGPIGRDLFEKEQDDLLADLIDIPKKACDRRVRCENFTLKGLVSIILSCVY